MTTERRRFCVVRSLRDGSIVQRFETTGHAQGVVDQIIAEVISGIDKATQYCCDEDEEGSLWETR